MFVPGLLHPSLGGSGGASGGGPLPTSTGSKGISPLHPERPSSGGGEHPRAAPGARDSGGHGRACSCPGWDGRGPPAGARHWPGSCWLCPSAFPGRGLRRRDAAGGAGRWRGGSERCLKSPLVLFRAQMASEAITVAMNAALFFTLKGKIPVSRARDLKDSGSVVFAPDGNKLFSK